MIKYTAIVLIIAMCAYWLIRGVRYRQVGEQRVLMLPVQMYVDVMWPLQLIPSAKITAYHYDWQMQIEWLFLIINIKRYKKGNSAGYPIEQTRN